MTLWSFCSTVKKITSTFIQNIKQVDTIETLLIRPARQDDAAALCIINKYALGYDFAPEKTAVRLAAVLASQANRVFVAELDGKAVGLLHGADYDCIYAPSLKNILALAVLPDYQGKGVGRALIAAVEAWARECGAEGVRLVSGFNRTGAHAFYAACGYALRKDQKNFFKLF